MVLVMVLRSSSLSWAMAARRSSMPGNATADPSRSARLTIVHPLALVDDSRVESRVRDRVTIRVAGNTRPRVSASTHPAGRQSRPGRMARRCRSSVAAVTTWAPDRVGCSVFLNNRYHDPGTGLFLSVDPLVASTRDPYLYAAGNPTTLSDPIGLSPQDACASGAKKSGCDGGVPQIGESNLVIPSNASAARFSIPVWKGAGVTRIQFFIDDDKVCLSGTVVDIACGHGDARGFAVGSALGDYNFGARARIVLNHETGNGMLISYATHGSDGEIDALPINVTVDGGVKLPEDYPSQLRLFTHGEGIDGNIVFDYRLINSETPSLGAGLAPGINGAIRVQRGPHNIVQVDGRLAQYPSVEIVRDYQLPNGYWSTLVLAKPQESGGLLNLYEPGEKFAVAG